MKKKLLDQIISPPLQFSFFSSLQAFPSYFSGYGVKLNVPYGNNKTVAGVDLGLANESVNLYGIGCAVLISRRAGHMCGVNVSGFLNLSEGSDRGVSIAGFYNEVDTINGIQMPVLSSRAKNVRLVF